MPRTRQRGGAAGFTLMEILVVLAIVAIMVVAVGLSVDVGGGMRRLETEAQRLASLVELACDESAQFGQDIGVRFESRGYRFVRAVGREWEPRASDTLRARRLPDGMHLELVMGERSVELEDVANGDALVESREEDAPSNTADDDGSAAFTPHMACDADGELSGEPRIAIHAGELRATLARDDEGGLRLVTEPEAG